MTKYAVLRYKYSELFGNALGIQYIFDTHKEAEEYVKNQIEDLKRYGEEELECEVHSAVYNPFSDNEVTLFEIQEINL